MPGLDGTGPLGQGPMTGRGMGFCVVKLANEDLPAQRGGAGVSGDGSETLRETGKEVVTMPAGDGTGPLGFGPMTGRAAGYCAGYPVPGYMNPIPGGGFWGRPVAGVYGPAPYAQGIMPYGYGGAYGYGAGYAPVWARPFGWFGRGFGRGRGRGFGRGRGRGRW